jgi:hypothetical protein
MATWDDVHRLALALPQTVAGSSREGLLDWSVKDKTLRGSGRCGEQTSKRSATPLPRGRSWPHGCPISGPRRRCWPRTATCNFTTPHFDGYPAILVRLNRIAMPELEELLVEAWLTRAPKRLATEYLDASR